MAPRNMLLFTQLVALRSSISAWWFRDHGPCTPAGYRIGTDAGSATAQYM